MAGEGGRDVASEPEGRSSDKPSDDVGGRAPESRTDSEAAGAASYSNGMRG